MITVLKKFYCIFFNYINNVLTIPLNIFIDMNIFMIVFLIYFEPIIEKKQSYLVINQKS